MNENKTHLKICDNCYYCIAPHKDKPNILRCLKTGGLIDKDFSCGCFTLNHADNMYSLCSCSECLDCSCFIKNHSFCNIGGKD